MDPTPYIDLLQRLIRIPSLSGQEEGTAACIEDFLHSRGIETIRHHHNIIAHHPGPRQDLPTIVLNSHHDTVAIGSGWTKDPLGGDIIDGKIYGRGSNDAGGALVAMIAIFCKLYHRQLPYHLVLIASGEEENFGPNGVSAVLHDLDIRPDLAIVGEPTELSVGVAEMGLVVIDAVCKGVSGHAARDIGTNAIYLALEDISRIRDFEWSRLSNVLGRTKSTVTMIDAGTQHNVIPDRCHYVIDCRVHEHYTLEEVLACLDEMTHAVLTPRSLKWRSSGIDLSHPIVAQALSLGLPLLGSPTLSDQVHFTCPSIKMGPGKSERSHTADEYIHISELIRAIEIYLALLSDVSIPHTLDR